MNMRFFMLNETVIDSHLHIYAWYNKYGEYFLGSLEKYRNEMGLKAINIAALPSGESNVCNNIMCAFYKLAYENTFAHGGLHIQCQTKCQKVWTLLLNIRN